MILHDSNCRDTARAPSAVIYSRIAINDKCDVNFVVNS